MNLHPLIDGPITVVVPPSEHPATAKGGHHQADIATTPGQNIYAPADGKIPHVNVDTFDGGLKTAVFFPLALTKEKKDGSRQVYVVLAHLNRTERGRALVKKGDAIGTASGSFLHVGCTDAAVLDTLIGL